MGKPGDEQTHLAVLKDLLRILVEDHLPGEVINLPYRWPEPIEKKDFMPAELPPISRHLRRHIRELPNLFRRDVPEKYRVSGDNSGDDS